MKTLLLGLLALACTASLFAQSPSTPPSAAEEEIFVQVDQAPKFPGCEGSDTSPLENCSDHPLLFMFYEELEYPLAAREHGIQGIVVVAFVVEKDGQVSNPQIKKGIGGGCDEAVVYMINRSNELGIAWTPGMKDGQPVRTKVEASFSFRLE